MDKNPENNAINKIKSLILIVAFFIIIGFILIIYLSGSEKSIEPGGENHGLVVRRRADRVFQVGILSISCFSSSVREVFNSSATFFAMSALIV